MPYLIRRVHLKHIKLLPAYVNEFSTFLIACDLLVTEDVLFDALNLKDDDCIRLFTCQISHKVLLNGTNSSSFGKVGCLIHLRLT